MRLLSLFINTPVAENLQETVPQLAQSGLFSLHVLKIDAELLPLLLEARPCVCVFSLSESTSLSALHQLLEELQRVRKQRGELDRNPQLRIVLVTEDHHLTLASWASVGVLEIIHTPIYASALVFKLTGHYHKAIAAERREEQWVAAITPDADAAGGEEAPGTARLPEWRLLESAPPAEEGDATEQTEVRVEAELPELLPDQGEWVLSASGEPDAWQWNEKLAAGREAPSPSGETKWVYRGRKPKHQPARGTWELQGAEPRLARVPWPGPGPREVLIDSESGGGKPVSLHVKEGVRVKSAARVRPSEGIPAESSGTKREPGEPPAKERPAPGAAARGDTIAGRSAPAVAPARETATERPRIPEERPKEREASSVAGPRAEREPKTRDGLSEPPVPDQPAERSREPGEKLPPAEDRRRGTAAAPREDHARAREREAPVPANGVGDGKNRADSGESSGAGKPPSEPGDFKDLRAGDPRAEASGDASEAKASLSVTAASEPRERTPDERAEPGAKDKRRPPEADERSGLDVATRAVLASLAKAVPEVLAKPAKAWVNAAKSAVTAVSERVAAAANAKDAQERARPSAPAPAPADHAAAPKLRGSEPSDSRNRAGSGAKAGAQAEDAPFQGRVAGAKEAGAWSDHHLEYDDGRIDPVTGKRRVRRQDGLKTGEFDEIERLDRLATAEEAAWKALETGTANPKEAAKIAAATPPGNSVARDGTSGNVSRAIAAPKPGLLQSVLEGVRNFFGDEN